MAAVSAPTTRARIPFFWWQHEAAVTRAAEVETESYQRCDTDYIPSSTADMWRSARHSHDHAA